MPQRWTPDPEKGPERIRPPGVESSRDEGIVDTRGRAIFTVDLEEYFQVGALREMIPKAEWKYLPSRVGWALDRLLGQLASFDAKATFFVSGWIVDVHPELARRVVDEGHEVAVLARPPRPEEPDRRRAEFERVARESRAKLEAEVDRRVVGFRTSGFTHPVPAPEAAAILSRCGYRYDSTLIDPRAFRSATDEDPLSPVARIRLDGGNLMEVPPTTFDVLGRRLFTVGGTAFRVLPETLVHRLLEREIEPPGMGVFFMRSWECDPAQPTLPVPAVDRVRLYWGLERVDGRLRRLLGTFSFQSVSGALGLDTEPGGKEERGADGARRDRSGPERRRRSHG